MVNKILKRFNRSYQVKKNKLIKLFEYLRFANDGYSLKDKLNSFYLRCSFERPFEQRPSFINKKDKEGNYKLEIRHKYFDNQKILFNLYDNFEMAICQEFFLFKIYDLDKLGFYPVRVLDVGAYKGYFTFLASSFFPNAKLYAFEPHPNNFLAMKQNFHRNKMFDISLVQSIVSGHHCDNATFYFNESNGSITSSFDDFKQTASLNITNLEDYLDVEKILIKIDIEGSERTIFPYIIPKLPKTCAIFLEIHHGQDFLNELKYIFLNCGFSFEILRNRELFTEVFLQRIQA